MDEDKGAMKRPRSLSLADRGLVQAQGAALEPIRRSGGKDWAARISLRPVSLCVVDFDRKLQPVGISAAAVQGCLRAGESVVVCGQSQSGKTEYLYHVVSEHMVSAEGAVLWITAPGCKRFDPVRFAEHLEAAVLRWHPLQSHAHCSTVGQGDDDFVAAALQERVTQCAERLQVCECGSIVEFLTLLDGSDTSRHWRRPPVSTTLSTPATPLLVIDGLGATEWLNQRERCVGTVRWMPALDSFVQVNHCATILSDCMFPHTMSRSSRMGTTSANALTIDAVHGHILSSCVSYRLQAAESHHYLHHPRRHAATGDGPRLKTAAALATQLRGVIYVAGRDAMAREAPSSDEWRSVVREAICTTAGAQGAYRVADVYSERTMAHLLLLFAVNSNATHDRNAPPFPSQDWTAPHQGQQTPLVFAKSFALFNIEANGVRFGP